MIEQKEDLNPVKLPEKRAFFASDIVWLHGFVLACGFATFYIYFWQVIVPWHKAASLLSGRILSGSAESPHAYRTAEVADCLPGLLWRTVPGGHRVLIDHAIPDATAVV